jgi:hypothetical protein
MTTSRPEQKRGAFSVFLISYGRAHRVRVERLIIGVVPPHAEGDAESPGSDGASPGGTPYLRRQAVPACSCGAWLKDEDDWDMTLNHIRIHPPFTFQ